MYGWTNEAGEPIMDGAAWRFEQQLDMENPPYVPYEDEDRPYVSEDEDDGEYMMCPKHNKYETIVDEGSTTGFAGGTIYFDVLECGQQIVDEDDDVRAAK